MRNDFCTQAMSTGRRLKLLSRNGEAACLPSMSNGGQKCKGCCASSTGCVGDEKMVAREPAKQCIRGFGEFIE